MTRSSSFLAYVLVGGLLSLSGQSAHADVFIAERVLKAGEQVSIGPDGAVTGEFVRNGSQATLVLTLPPPADGTAPSQARLPFVAGQRHRLIFRDVIRDEGDLVVEGILDGDQLRLSTLAELEGNTVETQVAAAAPEETVGQQNDLIAPSESRRSAAPARSPVPPASALPRFLASPVSTAREAGRS